MGQTKYIFESESNDTGSFRKFVITPTNYNRIWALNLVVFTVVVISAHFFICQEFTNGQHQKVFTMVSVLVSLALIRNPPIEFLSIFRSGGIQISAMRGCILFPTWLNFKLLQTDDFLPRDSINDVIINEGFTKGFKVIFYLAVLEKDKSDLKLVFPVCLALIIAKRSRKFSTTKPLTKNPILTLDPSLHNPGSLI
ncbi:LAMI_0E04038g1_1 [Lachancea mirantina]|uniref:LAMI_0E04038g1_1 n=1 Tax=Lachancea mirantina TaxID=1230905 RepID=A0A1G4JKB8_9SACH|nr:LAMI_0E04038g1_1 [Lachancea mirantina]